MAENTAPEPRPSNFLRDRMVEDLKTNKYNGRVQTRFPPEPNGYLHIGHAKAICLDFGLADEFGGHTNLRFDDTNPEKEDVEYVDSIMEDVKWLGFHWDRLLYASDYFDQLYEWAIKLIKDGKAYVDDLSADEIRKYRGTLTEPGKDSPYRNRSVEENLDLFERMKAGEFPDGSKVLRAKIDINLLGNRAAVDQIGHPSNLTNQRRSTSDIMTFCKRNRSVSNSSSEDVDLTVCGGPMMTCTLENGLGMMNRSQLFTRQQLEYSMLTGTTGALVFCARKIMPGPSS